MISGNWKSATVAQGYINNSMLMKRGIASMLSNENKENLASNSEAAVPVSRSAVPPVSNIPGVTSSLQPVTITNQTVIQYHNSNLSGCACNFGTLPSNVSSSSASSTIMYDSPIKKQHVATFNVSPIKFSQLE